MNHITAALIAFRLVTIVTLAGLVSSACTTAPQAGTKASGLLPTMRLIYAVTGQQGTRTLSGVFGELDWRRAGDVYDATLQLTFSGRTFRRQHSIGYIDANGLVPSEFSETRQKESAVHFDRTHGLAIFSVGTASLPLQANVQDRLSVVLQLGALLAADSVRHPVGSKLEIQVVGPRTADLWTFGVERNEVQSVPAGLFLTQKVVRMPRTEFDDMIEVWFSSQGHHLPIRIRQTLRNGDFVDMALQNQTPSLLE